MTVSWITMYTGVALNTDIAKGVSDRFRSLPIWRPAVLVGMLLADTARYLMAAAVVVTVGVALGFRPDGGPPGVLAAVGLLLVFAFSLSWLWTALGLRLKTPESVMQLSMTVLFPLTFASNVFVDTETMPGWVQTFVANNPITHLADSARGLMHGDAASTPILWVRGLERGAAGRLRPAHDAPLQRRALTPHRPSPLRSGVRFLRFPRGSDAGSAWAGCRGAATSGDLVMGAIRDAGRRIP